MFELWEDYYLDTCPRCRQFNEFLTEVCDNCGEQLYIKNTFLSSEEENDNV